jgi:voltage-gated potassium channel
MDRLRRIVFESDTKAGLYFDITIQVLIAVSLISFSIETLPGLSDSTYALLANIEFVIVIIFSIEYILRVMLSKKKLSYVFSFYGVVDLLSILPFYLSSSLSLQALRALRFIRLFRILKLARYSRAISRIGKALTMAKEELILFGFVTLILLYLSAIGIYHFEHAAQPEVFKSVFDSLWWAVATLTTVGYGDVYPITIGGRTFTFIVLMLGLGVVAVPTGIISSALSAVRRAEK